MSFPGGTVVKNQPTTAGDAKDRFDPWVGKIAWGRKWQPAPAFLPGKLHEQRSLAGYIQPVESQRVGHDWTHTQFTNNHKIGHSVQFSRSVVSDSLRLHEPQHARTPCLSPTPRVHPNPCPSSRWYHPTISSFVIPFSSCPQSFPASGSFQMSQLFTSGGQSIGVSASTSVPPINTQDWSPLGWTGWISLQS